jgi:hypothetical protein
LLSIDVRFTGENQEKVIETYGEYILLWNLRYPVKKRKIYYCS